MTINTKYDLNEYVYPLVLHEKRAGTIPYYSVESEYRILSIEVHASKTLTGKPYAFIKYYLIPSKKEPKKNLLHIEENLLFRTQKDAEDYCEHINKKMKDIHEKEKSE